MIQLRSAGTARSSPAPPKSASAARSTPGISPSTAIHYCLKTAGIKPNQIDAISHGFDYSPYRSGFHLWTPQPPSNTRRCSRSEKLLQQVASISRLPADRVHQREPPHPHAASAYYTSGWDECPRHCLDGMGENQSVTVYHARDNKIEKLAEVIRKDSIGILYSIITLHLGFDFNSDEYKIMGLAPYGDPARYRHFSSKPSVLDDGD